MIIHTKKHYVIELNKEDIKFLNEGNLLENGVYEDSDTIITIRRKT